MSTTMVISITAILSVLYMVLGIGAAKAVSGVNKEELCFIDVIGWPVILIIFAIRGQIR